MRNDEEEGRRGMTTQSRSRQKMNETKTIRGENRNDCEDLGHEVNIRSARGRSRSNGGKGKCGDEDVNIEQRKNK